MPGSGSTGGSLETHRSRFRRYLDRDAGRLVYVGATADPDFWDRRWTESGPAAYSGPISPRGLVVRETTRFLPPGSLVLEGGCGLALSSWRLRRLGYRTLALDYAQKTVQRVRAGAPEVRPLAGDVGRLPLPAASVDGYWSLGVIEHFYDGYAAIRDEMRRVVRPGGYLFLTFPAMSWLRRAKAGAGLYERWAGEPERREAFYQFALSGPAVAADFSRHGFELVRRSGALGVSGLCEELGVGGRWLGARLAGDNRPVRLARALLDLVARPVAAHMCVLVLHRRVSANRATR